MRIHDIKLPYGIGNKLILIQELVRNVCRVSIIVQNRMQEIRKLFNYAVFIYST